MISVTKEAADKLKEILEYPNNDTLRLFIAGAG
jgi:Fe-S cluster assembly iron-binding protein IscA